MNFLDVVNHRESEWNCAGLRSHDLNLTSSQFTNVLTYTYTLTLTFFSVISMYVCIKLYGVFVNEQIYILDIKCIMMCLGLRAQCLVFVTCLLPAFSWDLIWDLCAKT